MERHEKGYSRMTRHTNRRSGWMLIEAVIALTLITVGLLGFMVSVQKSFQANRQMSHRDLAQAALDGVLEKLRSSDFWQLYTQYQNARIPVQGLEGEDGNQAAVKIHFEVNEMALTPEYGPVEDIDGDGAKGTADAKTNYLILPTKLTLNYRTTHGMETKIAYAVLRS